MQFDSKSYGIRFQAMFSSTLWLLILKRNRHKVADLWSGTVLKRLGFVSDSEKKVIGLENASESVLLQLLEISKQQKLGNIIALLIPTRNKVRYYDQTQPPEKYFCIHISSPIYQNAKIENICQFNSSFFLFVFFLSFFLFLREITSYADPHELTIFCHRKI